MNHARIAAEALRFRLGTFASGTADQGNGATPHDSGFDATAVRLIADPQAGGNIHQVHVEGAFGEFDIEVRGRPLPDNPKTSTLAAHSVVAEIRRRAATVEI